MKAHSLPCRPWQRRWPWRCKTPNRLRSLQKTVDYTTRQYELSRNILLAQTPNEAYLALGQVFAMFAEIDRIQLLRVIERDANHRPADLRNGH